MKDFPIRSIFLPATFVGVSIFSIMAFSLPTLIEQYRPDGGLGTGGRSASRFTGIHKELVITYIGSAIVISASAGLGAAELLRKRSAQKAKAPNLKSMLAKLVDEEAQQQSSAELDQYFAAVLAEQSDDISDWPVPTAVTQQPTVPPDPPDVEADFSEAIFNSAWADQALADRFEAAQADSSAPAPEDDTVTIFPGQYQRCRIQVPGSPEQQYAIEFDQQFYSLLSSGVSKEQALAAVKQLSREQQAAILTRMNQGYAVWVLEPLAQVISVA